MAYKVLGQSALAATTNTDLYAVPAGKETVVSSITVCNRDVADITFRLAVRPGGAALADSHYIFFEKTVTAEDTSVLKLGITLQASDVITAQASNATCSISVFGDETPV